MRLPMPAAGTIPHILLCLSNHLFKTEVLHERHTQRFVEDALELCRPMSGRVRVQNSLTTSLGNPRQFRLRKLHCRNHIVSVTGDDDFSSWLEKRVEAEPLIGNNCDTARCCFKKTP